MKKILGIISLLVYLFVSSSIVHGSMMGIFPSHQIGSTSSCHETHDSDDTKNNLDCCELVYSNQYTQCSIRLKDSIQLSSFNFLSIPTYVSPETNITTIYKPYFALNPGWQADSKYQKFSDLVGIIVDLA